MLAHSVLSGQDCKKWPSEKFFRKASVRDVSRCIDGGADLGARERQSGDTPLHMAAIGSRNPSVIEALLAAGAEINARSDDGSTPLQAWQRSGHGGRRDPEVFKALLAAGANPNVSDSIGWTPLHYAVSYAGDAALVRALLKAGADPNARIAQESWYEPLFTWRRNAAGDTPLHRAAYNGAGPLVIEALLAAGADPNARSEDGSGPLHRLAEPARVPRSREVAEILLAAGADPNARTDAGSTPLLLASFTASPVRNGALVSALLAAGADPNLRGDSGESPLHNAIRNLDVVEALLAARADPNVRDQNGRTPLHRTENLATIKALIAAGAEVDLQDGKGIPPLFYAMDDPLAGKALLAAGADPNQRWLSRDGTEMTALHHLASRKGYLTWVVAQAPALVEALIAAGAEVDARDDEGKTPLMRARENGDRAVARALLEAGANPDPVLSGLDCERWASEWFFRRARVRDVSKCIDGGANPNVRLANFNGRSPLHMATRNLEMVKALLAAGADPNPRDDDGQTPLHRTGNPATIEALIAAGAEVDALNRWGTTPLFYAMNDPSAANALLAAGADPNQRWRGGTGMTPLHQVASRREAPEPVKGLAQYSSVLPRDTALALVEALVAAGAEVDARDEQGKTPLMRAQEYKDTAVATALLATGADPDPVPSGPNCKQWASEEFFRTASVSDVTKCLDSGADPMAREARSERTPLHMAAIASREPTIVKALLATGAEINARDVNGETPLQAWCCYHTDYHGAITACRRDPDVFKALLAAGADPNVRDDKGWTPLHVVRYDEALVTALIEAGAEVEARTPPTSHRFGGGETPLHVAVRLWDKTHLPAVKALLAAGANPNAADRQGCTPLHRAIRSYGTAKGRSDMLRDAELVRILLAAGANPNARDVNGSTPLHRTAERRNASALVEALVAGGAELGVQDRWGDTPMIRARNRGNGVVARALVKAARHVAAKRKH